MDDYHYETNCSQYVLMDGKTCLYGPYDSIGIAFDKESCTLHKHGDPARVAAWHAKTTKAYMDAGYKDMADDILCISGRFPLDEINKCISHSGYARVFYEKLMAGEIAELPVDYGPAPSRPKFSG